MKGSENAKGMWRSGTAVLLAARALALVCTVCSVDCAAQSIPRAADATAATASSSEAQGIDTHPARVASHPNHRTAGQGIEESARRLGKGLELDAAQQAKLRQLLENQRRQIRRLWADIPPEADHVGSTLAILKQTQEQIRAMLNEEQRQKYPAAFPQEQLGPAQADLETWMRIMQSKPPRDAGNAN